MLFILPVNCIIADTKIFCYVLFSMWFLAIFFRMIDPEIPILTFPKHDINGAIFKLPPCSFWTITLSLFLSNQRSLPRFFSWDLWIFLRWLYVVNDCFLIVSMSLWLLTTFPNNNRYSRFNRCLLLGLAFSNRWLIVRNCSRWRCLISLMDSQHRLSHVR